MRSSASTASRAAALERASFTASDGAEIEVHVAGERDRPALLAVNPIGMPLDFWKPFVERFASRFRLYLWRMRGVPAPREAASVDLDLSTPRLLNDGTELVERFGPKRLHLVGWCTGARTALRLAESLEERVESLVLLNGAYNLDEPTLTTPYQRALIATVARLVQNPELSELYLRLLAAARWQDAPEGRVGSLLSVIEPDVAPLANLPFESAANLKNYARLIHHFDRDRASDWLRQVRTRTLIVTGPEDRVTAPAESRRVAGLLPNAELCHVGGGHFAVYRAPDELAERLNHFWS